MAFNAYGSVTHNTIIAPAGVDAGVMVQDYTNNTVVPSSLDVSNNNVTIGQDGAGIWVNLFHPTVATALTVNSNTVNAATGRDGYRRLDVWNLPIQHQHGWSSRSVPPAIPLPSVQPVANSLRASTFGTFRLALRSACRAARLVTQLLAFRVDNDDISFWAPGAATTVDISGVLHQRAQAPAFWSAVIPSAQRSRRIFRALRRTLAAVQLASKWMALMHRSHSPAARRRACRALAVITSP